MNRLDNKIAVVTGGTQGLGAAIARRFAEAGAAGIVTCGRNTAKARPLRTPLRSRQRLPVKFVPADLANVDDCRRIIAEADKALAALTSWSMPRGSPIAATC